MPRMTHSEYIAHEERVSRTKKNRIVIDPETSSEGPLPPPVAKAVGEYWMKADRETGKGGLHEQIMDYCNAQWPRWKFIHSRTDQKSTVAVGSHDFTVFLPGGRVVCVEAKAKGGKLSNEQLAWAKELSMLGHGVHVVFSLEEFKRVVEL